MPDCVAGHRIVPLPTNQGRFLEDNALHSISRFDELVRGEPIPLGGVLMSFAIRGTNQMSDRRDVGLPRSWFFERRTNVSKTEQSVRIREICTENPLPVPFPSARQPV